MCTTVIKTMVSTPCVVVSHATSIVFNGQHKGRPIRKAGTTSVCMKKRVPRIANQPAELDRHQVRSRSGPGASDRNVRSLRREKLEPVRPNPQTRPHQSGGKHCGREESCGSALTYHTRMVLMVFVKTAQRRISTPKRSQ